MYRNHMKSDFRHIKVNVDSRSLRRAQDKLILTDKGQRSSKHYRKRKLSACRFVTDLTGFFLRHY